MKRIFLALAFLSIGTFAVQAKSVNHSVAVAAMRAGGPDIIIEEGWAYLTLDVPMTKLTLTNQKGNVVFRVYPNTYKYQFYVKDAGTYLLTVQTAKDETYIVPVTID